MGITSALVQQVGSGTKIKMLRLSVVLLLPALIVASPEAEPSGYGGGCQTTYDTVYTKVCATSYDKRCQQSAKTEYQTEYDTKCETTYLKNCFPVPRQVPDQECRTEYDQVCTKNSKTTIETRTDTQCKDIVKKVCSDVRVEVGPVVPGPTKVVAAGYGGGYHKREAEASDYGYAPKCQEVRDRQCQQIPISVPRTIEVPVCKKVPRTVCVPSYKVVLDTKCQEIPKQQCAQIPRQVAIQVPFEVCEDIPIEQCKQVPKKVPRKICKSYGPPQKVASYVPAPVAVAKPVAVVAPVAVGYAGAGYGH